MLTLLIQINVGADWILSYIAGVINELEGSKQSLIPARLSINEVSTPVNF
jgi:hypothetical protein